MILIAVICSLLTILVLILTDYSRRAGREDAGLSLICEDHTEDELEELWRLPAADRDGAE